MLAKKNHKLKSRNPFKRELFLKKRINRINLEWKLRYILEILLILVFGILGILWSMGIMRL